MVMNVVSCRDCRCLPSEPVKGRRAVVVHFHTSFEEVRVAEQGLRLWWRCSVLDWEIEKVSYGSMETAGWETL